VLRATCWYRFRFDGTLGLAWPVARVLALVPVNARGPCGRCAADGAEIEECGRWRRRRHSRTFVGGVRQFCAPDVKVGLRDRIIPAECGDALAARGMPRQMITPARFF